jgi:cytochrome c oxidase cbb3-type subunit 3
LILYPGLGSSEGRLAWTSEKQYQQEVDQANADVATLYARFDGMAAEQVALDPQARYMGEHLFLNNSPSATALMPVAPRAFPI